MEKTDVIVPPVPESPPRKVLGDVTIEELTGVKKGNDVVLVNVNRAILSINCGSLEDFVSATTMTAGVKGVVWNEGGITLILNDRYTSVKYEPNIHPLAKIFLEHSSLRGRQWGGEYEPVKFTKTDLIRFLQTLQVYGGTADIIDLVKDVKMRQSRHEHDMISLDEDKSVSVVEESFQSNIPKTFTLKIPVTPDFVGEFKFDVSLEKPGDRYDRGESAGNKIIVLRCTNPLDVLRGNMLHVLDCLPKEIPRLYGQMEIKSNRERW